MSELPEKDISNVVVQCGRYSTISCRGLCLNYLKKISQISQCRRYPLHAVVSVSTFLFQHRQYSRVSCHSLGLNHNVPKLSKLNILLKEATQIITFTSLDPKLFKTRK